MTQRQLRDRIVWTFQRRACFTRLCMPAAAAIGIVAVLAAKTFADAAGTGPGLRAADFVALQDRLGEFSGKLPDPAAFGADRIVAFEENGHFVYVAGEKGATLTRRLVYLKPGVFIVDDVAPAAAEKKLERSLRVIRVRGSGKEVRLDIEPIEAPAAAAEVTAAAGEKTFQLRLPASPDAAGSIAARLADGKAILPERPLPAGVMPHGPAGVRMIERWDAAYRDDRRPPWDKGFPSSHLKAAVESGTVAPGRAVVLGCGTGTNAIYLAKRGFDVTAVDVAPTALARAQAKAKEAGVTLRWLLADVTAPPAGLEPFDFIFDRGCYHGVRRGNARGYVEAVKKLSRPGTQMLILAGNANEERHYGPPRVKEEELRGDFSGSFDFVSLKTIRFDPMDADDEGAMAWFALLRRKENE